MISIIRVGRMMGGTDTGFIRPLDLDSYEDPSSCVRKLIVIRKIDPEEFENQEVDDMNKAFALSPEEQEELADIEQDLPDEVDELSDEDLELDDEDLELDDEDLESGDKLDDEDLGFDEELDDEDLELDDEDLEPEEESGDKEARADKEDIEDYI